MKFALSIALAVAAAAPAQIRVDTFPMSARLTPDRKFLLVLNAGPPSSVSVIDVAATKETARVPVPGAWLGLTLNKAGDRVYVGGASKAAVYEFTFIAGTLKPSRTFPVAGSFVGDVQLAPDGHLLYAADLFGDSVVVVNPQSGFILSRIKTGRRPYRIVFHPSGKRMYVSAWADGSVGQYDTETGTLIASLRLAPHPTDMVWAAGEVEDRPDVTGRLFVAASNTNSIFALASNDSGDLSRLETIGVAQTPGQPLGVMPSGLSVSADAKDLFVALSGIDSVAKLDISHAHATTERFMAVGRYPMAAVETSPGNVAVLNARDGTVQTDTAKDAAPLEKFEAGAPPPIAHVVYILADSVKATPAGALRLANFHGTSSNIVETLNQATAGIATGFTERLAPALPSDRFEGRDPADSPPAGFLWTAGAQAGLSMRNYGLYATNRKTPDADGTQLADVRDPVLAPITDGDFRGPDPAYPDAARIKEFVSEVDDFSKDGKMPQLLFMRLAGDVPALEIMIAALAKSRFWSDTAIFIVSPVDCFIASPLAVADPGAYNTLSVLRTVESIFGLKPMTIFDAAARPLFNSFKAPR